MFNKLRLRSRVSVTEPLVLWLPYVSSVWPGSVMYVEVYAYVTGRPCGSVAQWSECSPVTFGGSVWVRARAASSKGTVLSVPAWLRADSGTNLIKQGEFVTGRPCGSVAQWSECSHGMREVLGLSPGRTMCSFPLLWHLESQGKEQEHIEYWRLLKYSSIMR